MYIIQHRIHTLARYYTDGNNCFPSFELDGIKFSHWSFNFVEGHKTHFWLTETQISANDFRAAISEFNKKISPVIAKVSLLSQCYSEYLNEPYLVYKQNSDIAFFRYTKSSRGVPLVFDGSSFKALEALQKRQDISTEFYYYWNDMINATGYSAKLLLICSALEALVKSSINSHGKKSKHDFLSAVLGDELREKMWNQKTGVRHRLTHGEYFDKEADNENYLQQIHEKVIRYFNDQIFREEIININVKNPQRHPDENKRGGSYFIKLTNESPSFDLKSLVDGCDEDFSGYISKFELPTEDIGCSY